MRWKRESTPPFCETWSPPQQVPQHRQFTNWKMANFVSSSRMPFGLAIEEVWKWVERIPKWDQDDPTLTPIQPNKSFTTIIPKEKCRIEIPTVTTTESCKLLQYTLFK